MKGNWSIATIAKHTKHCDSSSELLKCNVFNFYTPCSSQSPLWVVFIIIVILRYLVTFDRFLSMVNYYVLMIVEKGILDEKKTVQTEKKLVQKPHQHAPSCSSPCLCADIGKVGRVSWLCSCDVAWWLKAMALSVFCPLFQFIHTKHNFKASVVIHPNMD